MKKITLFLTLVILTQLAYAQCPAAPIVLNTQAEVDAFAVDYPGCTQLLDDLEIGDFPESDITNLAGLSQITEVQGNLEIEWNPLLTSLSGLTVNVVGTNRILNIHDNPLLTSLDGISVPSGSSLCGPIIYNNDNLESLNVLSGIDFSSSNCSLVIVNNDSLQDLTGLEGVTSCSWVDIRDNELLEDLTALSNLVGPASGNFEISGNPLLTDLSGLEGITDVLGEFFIISNNDSLTSLDGLDNLTNANVGTPFLLMGITGNPVLTDINALSQLIPSSILGFGLNNNPNLSQCSIDFLCAFIDQGGDVGVENNAPGCNSVPEVEAGCLLNITETELATMTLVSPNPVVKWVRVSIPAGTDLHQIQVYDVGGKSILISSETTLDMSGLPVGMFILKIETDQGSVVRKIIKR